ncbi:hypothetical protein L3X38_003372 [Prunus dulcis]|uniref:Uncharacterized protein n=1 Tax=Prunus dulcis TaxID=3755 RepID=A0AAD4ZLX9_PRUDU|nr:hypothetical protein L3X38_003372 [Prunus dulcis]
MASKSQSKEAQASKGQGKDIAISKAQMGESKSVPSNPAKKMRFTSSSEKDPSSTTFDEVTRLTHGPEGADLGSCSNGLCCWGRGQEDGLVCSQKMEDFKSTLTRQFILPFANEKEKLKEPPQLYNFIEKSQWDAFVASRLSQDFEAMHSKQP